jgi:HSP20 family protein
VKIVAEVPGVRKEDINLTMRDSKLVISVDTETRKYYKELEVSEDVDPEKAKATYNNGVLEVILPKKSATRPQRSIKVE